LRALILDLDDTLVPTSRLYDRAAVAAWRGAVPAGLAAARAAVKGRLGDGAPAARNRLLYFKECLERDGCFTAAALLAIMDRYETELAALVRASWLELKRDALFAALRARFRLVVATNENTRTQLVKLRAMDPDGSYFERLVTSEEVGVEKPDVRVLKRAVQILDLPPAELAVVGDSVAADVTPALSLGMRALVTREFADDAHPAPAGAQTIRSLEELRSL